MRLLYFFTLTLLSAATSFVAAQETAEKISDFNYGLSGENVITSIHAVNGQLYANLFQIYGDDAAGLLSTLNPLTGASTALLDPQRTDWFTGDRFVEQPSVFSVGGMTFGIQRDRATGNNLYRLDGASPELLISSTSEAYTQPVILGDSLYFLAAGFPLRERSNQNGFLLAELWRTDGTSTGTQLVTPLFSFLQSGELARIVAGSNKLFINIMDNGDQIFYLYEPNGDGLGLLAEGFSQFFLDTPFGPVENPVAYSNGGFYIYTSSRADAVAEVFRVDEETFEIEEVVLPVIPSRDFPFLPAEYDQIEFLNFQDSLYLFAMRSGGENGNDLYRIGGPDGLTVTEVLAQPEILFSIREDYFSPAVYEDTLYYLSRRGEDDVTIYAYEPSMGTPQELFNVFFDGSFAYLAANQDFVYITLPNDDQVLRYNKRTGDVTSVSVGLSNEGTFFLRPRINPLAILDEGAYVVDNNLPDSGLRFLATTADTMVSFGNFIAINERANPFLYGQAGEGTLVLSAGDPLAYLATEDRYQNLSFAAGLDSTTLFTLLQVEDNTYFLTYDTAFNGRISQLTANTFQPLPLAYSGTFNEEHYSVDPLTQFNIGAERRVVSFNANTQASTSPQLLIATFGKDSLRLTEFLPSEFSSRLSLFFANAQYFVIDVAGPEERELIFYDYNSIEQFRIFVPLLATLRAIDENGVYVEGINEETFTSTMSYHSLDGSTVTELEFTNATNAYTNRSFYPLDGKLLFVGDTREMGREWLVADPASSSVTVLKDINPGRGFGVFATTNALLTEEGMFFSANDGVNGNELWFTDGTEEGTQMLPEVNPGANSANPSDFVVIDSTVFFAANGPNGYELYRMHLRDRTPELIIDLHPGPGDAHPYGFTRMGENFYFFGREAVGSTYELYTIAFDLVPVEAEPTRTPARVFPNPVGHLPLTIEAPAGETIQRVQLFSPAGQLLRDATVATERTSLQLDGLPAGQYWLRTWYASGRFSINAVQRVR